MNNMNSFLDAKKFRKIHKVKLAMKSFKLISKYTNIFKRVKKINKTSHFFGYEKLRLVIRKFFN